MSEINEDLLLEAILHWEPKGVEVVRVIDTDDMTVERIFKYRASDSMEMIYSLHRYVQLGLDSPGIGIRVECSIDLQDVDADRVIQFLGERL